MRRLAWVCAFAFASAIPLDALSLRSVPDDYTRRVWQTEDGLPENTVQAFAQTPSVHYRSAGKSKTKIR
jgi:hypothetical protein